ncbi:MAG: MBL fold metallo-hydrolase, partial [Cyclobacteriaceae bacterium]
MKRLIRWIKRIMIATLVIIAIIAIGLIIFLQQPQFGQPPKADTLAQVAGIINHNGKTFQNKDRITTTMSPLKALSLIPKWLSTDGEKVPSWSIPIKHRKKEEFESIPDSLVRLTWFGHSAFLLEIEGKRLLLDPMFGPRPSPIPFGSGRFNDTLPLAINDLPPIDAVLFSHDHYDHLDYPSVLQLKDKVGHFYVPLGLGSHLKKWGVASDKITELDWWQEVDFGDLTFACTPAQHFSGRGLNDRDKTLW